MPLISYFHTGPKIMTLARLPLVPNAIPIELINVMTSPKCSASKLRTLCKEQQGFVSSTSDLNGGTQCCSWLRHRATSLKIAGSIPDDVIRIFHRHNPSGRIMALGLTQPLTEMSTRNISWGVKAAGA